MSTKKPSDALGLAPIASELSPASASLVPWRSRRSLSVGEKRLTEEEQRQLLTIDIIAVKGRFGATKIEQIHRHGAQAFSEGLAAIYEIKDQAGRSQEHQQVVDAFMARQVQLLAQHELGVVDASATNIGEVVYRSVEPPPPPPPPPMRRVGLVERLFGTWE